MGHWKNSQLHWKKLSRVAPQNYRAMKESISYYGIQHKGEMEYKEAWYEPPKRLRFKPEEAKDGQ